jgi:hypothetical protein
MGAAARVRLGAAYGSRQSFNVKLATAILDNVNACLKYDDQVRVGGDPNQPSCRVGHKGPPIAYMVHAHGDIKKASQRHAMHNFVNAVHSLKYHALSSAKQE